MKKTKMHKENHVSQTKYGMGDFYGSGIKQKVGKVRVDQINYSQVKSKKLGKPPKSLA